MTMTAREIADGIMDEHAPSDWRGWALKRDLRDAIESAILAAERRPVKVNPLEWVSGTMGSPDTAESIAGRWKAWSFSEISYYQPPWRGSGLEVRGGIDNAKSAAQADYEARIRSALESGEDRRAEIVAAERRSVKVKPLEWLTPLGADTLTRAETFFGFYRVWTHHEAKGQWFVALYGPAGGASLWSKTVADEAEGHAAAQADYEARIRSALAPEGDGWFQPLPSPPKATE